MTRRTYLLAALAVFVFAVTGSDIIARTTIAQLGFGEAAREHLQWLSMTVFGVALLFVPFGVAALICATANKRARTRGVATLFVLTMATLAYFYFEGFQASQYAMLDERWTAATLSIGLLPFFIGVPVLFGITLLAAVLVRFDRKPMPEF